MNSPSDQSILHAQLLDLLDEFKEFGKTASGGITRLAASFEEKLARDHLCRWLKDQDIEVLIDPIGNIFGVLDLGENYPDRAFFCGSHLDSQPEGGNFDGVLGVASACIASVNIKAKIAHGELDPTYRYFVICCWTGEEGARFQPSLIGSSVFSGNLPLDEALSLRDSNQIQLKDALYENGFLGTDRAPIPSHYLEIHIEQGTKLEKSGAAIGLVGACWGAEKIRVKVEGTADHTGPTPMEGRRDALLAASLLIAEIRIISDSSEHELYSSVGRMELHPNSPNTVVDQAELWIEFRSASGDALRDALCRLEKKIVAIAEQTGCNLNIETRETRGVTEFDSSSIDQASQSLTKANISYQLLDTIAGHDAIRLQEICPSTLLFTPSKAGVTHSPAEYTSDKDVCKAFDGMSITLLRQISLAYAGP